MFSIRPLQPEEAGFLESMLYEAIFTPPGTEKPPYSIIQHPDLEKYYSDWGKDNLDIAVVTVESNELAGAAWGRKFSYHNKAYGFVNEETPELSMAVKETFRNRGIGTALLKSLLNEYRKRGVASVSLSVDKENPAIHLYERFGFRVIEDKANPTMILSLSQS